MNSSHNEIKSVIGAIVFFVAAYVLTQDFTKSVTLLVMAAVLIAEIQMLKGKK